MNEPMIEKIFGVVDGWVERAIVLGEEIRNGVSDCADALERIAKAQEEIANNDPLKRLDSILSGAGVPDPQPRGLPNDPFGGRDPFEASGS